MNDLYDPLPGSMNKPTCKTSPTTHKETPPNGDELDIVGFSARSKCPKVPLPTIDISSTIKNYK